MKIFNTIIVYLIALQLSQYIKERYLKSHMIKIYIYIYIYMYRVYTLQP